MTTMASAKSGTGQDGVGFMSKRGAAAYCALSPRSLDYARERGELPFHKVGKKVVFRISDLEAFMARFRVAV